MVVFGERQRHRDQGDVNGQPGHTIVSLDHNQAGGQRDIKQALCKERNPRTEADPLHDAKQNQHRAKHGIKRLEQHRW